MMKTIAQNNSNSFGYMKCGEILKTPQSSQDPYILRCIQCQEIYLLLESFILHFEDECNIASSAKKRIRKTKAVKDSPDKTKDAVIQEDENPAVKLETNNQMQMEDPLIVVKNEADDDNSMFEEEPKLQDSAASELLENPESNFFMVSEYHNPDDDDDDGETSVNSQDDNECEEKESDEAQANLSKAQRNHNYLEKLKARGKYEEYKKRQADKLRERRQREKIRNEKLTHEQRKQILADRRRAGRVRTQKYRANKKNKIVERSMLIKRQ